MELKNLVIQLLIEVEKEDKYSNIVLNSFFKENPIDSKERGFITEIFYGVIRKKLFLDKIIELKTRSVKKLWIKNLLRISIYQITFMESDVQGVVWEAVELTKKKFGETVGRFINGTLRSYLRDKESIIADMKKNNEALYLSYPKWFYEKIKDEYGDNYLLMLNKLKERPYLSFRVNKLKYSEDEMEKLLSDKGIKIIKKVGSLYYVDSGVLLYSKEFAEGKFIVQDAASYIAAKNLAPSSEDLVLDACCAPGGKTAVLSELMNNRGEITAIDIYPQKVAVVEDNLKKLGVTNVRVSVMDARKVNNQGKKFDKILVDAPCSGYGVVAKKPESLYRKKPANVKVLSALQSEILSAAADVLKAGGEMIYSTCTILDEENKDNVRNFLKNNQDFITLKLEIPDNVSGTYDEFGGFNIDYKEDILDSFYIVKFKKR